MPLNRRHLEWSRCIPASIFGISVIFGLFRSLVLERKDPYHCHSLLTRGRWLDTEFRNWQPESCMMHTYNPTEVKQCLKSKRVVFIGDSTTRQLFFSMARLADPTLPASPPSSFEKHSDLSLPAGTGTWFDFFWDPFLNSTKTDILLNAGGYGGEDKPAMLVLGSGLWYLRYHDDKTGEDGISSWKRKMGVILNQIINSMPGLADEVVILPVQNPTFSKLSPDRAAVIKSSDINTMNQELLLQLSSMTAPYHPIFPNFPNSTLGGPVPILFPSVFNDLLDSSQTIDGLHYNSRLTMSQSQILLNHRCNGYPPKRFPFDKTCCSGYPRLSPAQVVILIFLICIGPIPWIYQWDQKRRYPDQQYVPNRLLNPNCVEPLLTFGATVGFCLAADRSFLWVKEQKEFSPIPFGFLCIVAIVGCALSVKIGTRDLGFLNRSQTDEWKGWMQVLILIYHYFSASKVKVIYPIIRVFVASFLFMTGYGHTTFYLNKADYSLRRIAQVLTRLNILTILLVYVMDTNYMFYYFVPLVSFWYLVVHFTLFIGSAHNDHASLLAGKILTSFIIIMVIHSQLWVLEGVFRFLKQIANIEWSPAEWAFRIKLDAPVVYIGMIVSIAVNRLGFRTDLFQSFWLTSHCRWSLIKWFIFGMCALSIICFALFEVSRKSKFAYNAWHPFISFVPILAFIVLRNASPMLRGSSSKLAEWIGQMSLEIFVLQSHIWLAADSKGVLLIVPGSQMRALNFVVNSICLLWTSNAVSKSTRDLTTLLFGGKHEIGLPTASAEGSYFVLRVSAGRGGSNPVTESTSNFVNGERHSDLGAPDQVMDPTKPTDNDEESIPLVITGLHVNELDSTANGHTTSADSRNQSPMVGGSVMTETGGDELHPTTSHLQVDAIRSTSFETGVPLYIRVCICLGILWLLNLVPHENNSIVL